MPIGYALGGRGTLRGLRNRRSHLVLPHAKKATIGPPPETYHGAASEKSEPCGADAEGQAPATGRSGSARRWRGRSARTLATLGAVCSTGHRHAGCASNLRRQSGLRRLPRQRDQSLDGFATRPRHAGRH